MLPAVMQEAEVHEQGNLKNTGDPVCTRVNADLARQLINSMFQSLRLGGSAGTCYAPFGQRKTGVNFATAMVSLQLAVAKKAFVNQNRPLMLYC